MYDKCRKKTLVPWRISVVNPPDLTFRGYYHREETRYIKCGPFVGSSKDQLDVVDSDLKVLDVTCVFGSYAKFLVEEIDGRQSANGEGECNYMCRFV